MRHAALLGVVLPLAWVASFAQVAVPPGTDIHLVALESGVASMKDAVPTPVAVRPGYDNQPAFSADGRLVFFSSSTDGSQTDAFELTRATGAVRRVWETPDSEYSPTPTPDGRGLSVIRVEEDGTQRLWRYGLDGGDPSLLLPDIKPVGYHAWVGDDHLGLYVLGEPATLQIAQLATGRAAEVARGVGRSLHRVPGTRLVSFVQEDEGEFWISTVNVDTSMITRLAQTVEGSSNRDYAWTSDGEAILMTAGTTVQLWRLGTETWTEVFDGASHGLGALSRLAVSPTGDAVALVSAEAK